MASSASPASPSPAPSPSPDQELVLAIVDAAERLGRRLDGAVSTIKGISFAEYRILRCLADAPAGRASRVDLAEAVSLTPSGVTRALRPLEKLGFVETIRSERDARLALATLTGAGEDLVADASAVIDDAAADVVARAPRLLAEREVLLALPGLL